MAPKAPPKSRTSKPRWSRYQAASAAGSRARMKTPPSPSTLCLPDSRLVVTVLFPLVDRRVPSGPSRRYACRRAEFIPTQRLRPEEASGERDGGPRRVALAGEASLGDRLEQLAEARAGRDAELAGEHVAAH